MKVVTDYRPDEKIINQLNFLKLLVRAQMVVCIFAPRKLLDVDWYTIKGRRVDEGS